MGGEVLWGVEIGGRVESGRVKGIWFGLRAGDDGLWKGKKEGGG